MIKLIRFELAYNNEPLEVGFLQGIGEVELNEEIEEELLEPFNAMKTPNFGQIKRNNISFFTEKGLKFFEYDINAIEETIKEQDHNWSLIVIEKTIKNSDEVLYNDDLQYVLAV